ncbi:RIB43A-like with coiled-coils protein 2 [Caerostris darwini]|uniref:RIB43A-like with coiled-coils protein 2 n=1 Tax=Caerostris darwini TaxID=1538125 RepID=A0AAV4N3L8_9ARAC|nr:RIB43A-like with coiled-coils protein 2 [Caerostris darwini]
MNVISYNYQLKTLQTFKTIVMDNQRRIFEEQRKKRIFNAKQRQIGLDIKTLNQQVYENHLHRTRVAENEGNLAEKAKNYNSMAILINQQRKKEIREQCKDIDTEQPARVSDDAYCPISGIQRLEGEDSFFKNRLKTQRNQIRDNLLQQILEKKTQKLSFKQSEHNWETSLLERDSYALQSSISEQNDRKKASIQLGDDNRNLAWQNQENRRFQKFKDETEGRKHIEYHYYGDMLTENPDVAKHPYQSHRILPDRWKGMSKIQVEEYYRSRVNQMQENQIKREQVRQKEEDWKEFFRNQQTMMQRHNNAEEREKRELCKQLELENQQLAKQQKEYQEYFNKVINCNIPSEKYYNQFNTSSR